MTFRFATVRSKLLSLQALLVVLIAVVNALVGNFVFSKYLNSAQREKLKAGTESMVMLVSAFVQDHSYQLKNLATADAAKSYNKTHNPLVLQQHFSGHSGRFPVISLINSKGVEEVKNVFGDVNFNFIDYSHNSIYLEAKKASNRVRVSALRFDRLVNAYVLDFAFHYTDYFDEDQGTFLASALVEDLRSQLKKIRDNDEGHYLVFNGRGDIVVTNYDYMLGWNVHEVPDIDPSLFGIIKEEENKFIESLDLSGQECVVSISSVNDLGWKVLNIVPHSIYYSSLHKLRISNMIIATIVLVIGFLLIFFIARSITVPIVNLEQIMSNTSSGQDIYVRARVKSDDEIGRLADAFNNLLDRIEASKKEITETKNYLDSIIRYMTDFMMVTDNSGTITVVNQNVLEFNDIAENDLIGKKLHVLMKDQDGQPIFGDDELKVILQTGAIHQKESEVYNWKGQKQFLSISATVLKNVHGERNGIVFIAQDISQRKKAEEKHAKLEQELQQARKMEAIGTLAGGIAHDFNTLIGTVIGYAEMISADLPATSPLQEDLANIVKVSERATKLVSQIREFSRPKDSAKQETDIVSLVKNNIHLIRTLVPKTVKIEEEYLVDEQPVFANIDQLNQVLVNLCTNAVDVMTVQKGTIRIKLALNNVTNEGMAEYPGIEPATYVRISVADDGWGMAPEIIERIFDPYFTTKEIGKGSGMGLSVVHSVVTGHSGYIFVHSTLNQGTTFDIFLPTLNKKNHG